MFRSLKQVKLNDTEFRYVVRIEDDPSPANTQLSKFRQRDFLRALIDTHGLMDCGNQVFQSMKMWHDGEKWLMELEAVGP